MAQPNTPRSFARWLCVSALLCEFNPPARVAAGYWHSLFIDGKGRLSSCGNARSFLPLLGRRCLGRIPPHLALTADSSSRASAAAARFRSRRGAARPTGRPMPRAMAQHGRGREARILVGCRRWRGCLRGCWPRCRRPDATPASRDLSAALAPRPLRRPSPLLPSPRVCPRRPSHHRPLPGSAMKEPLVKEPLCDEGRRRPPRSGPAAERRSEKVSIGAWRGKHCRSAY